MKTKQFKNSNRGFLLSIPITSAILLLALQLVFVSAFAKASTAENAEPVEIYPQSTITSGQVITIGFAGPVAGPLSDLGLPIANSVQLAIDQTNTSGGLMLGGTAYQLALVIVNDDCSPSLAPSAANALIAAGAVAVVGHICSSASLAAEPIYNAAGITMISPSSTFPDITQQGYTTTFRTVTHDGEPPALLAYYFGKWMHLSKSAIIETPNSVFGSLTSDYYQDAFVATGGTITSRRTVTNTGQFTSTITAIMGENPDAIFLNDPDPDFAGTFDKIAFSLGMTNTVIGWHAVNAEQFMLDGFVSSAGASSEGVFATYSQRPTRDMPGWSSFLAAYQAANFANSPDDPGPYGPYAYDAAQIIISAIERGGSANPMDIRDQIAATQDFNGVVGVYKGFSDNGDVDPPWTWLAYYENTQWNEIHLTDLFLPLVVQGLSR